MTDTKHTPGPWVVSGRYNRWGDNLVVPAGSEVRADGYLAAVRGPADARLIAAAPELLAALEMLVDAVTDSTAGSTRAYREHAIRDARAAIARAKGGES